jgi:tetratricopeptide (TPR) repeat protein
MATDVMIDQQHCEHPNHGQYMEAFFLDTDAWYNNGTALDNLGKYEEAIQCYDRVLEIDGKYVEAWYNKGTALDNLGKYEEAIQCYDKALEIDNKYTDAYYNRARSKCRLNRVNECLIDLKVAATLDENYIGLAIEDEDFDSIKDNEEFNN